MTRLWLAAPAGLLLSVAASPLPGAEEESRIGVRATFLPGAESLVLTGSVHLDRRPVTDLSYSRRFESSDFDGWVLEGIYEWRPYGDSPLAVSVSAGFYSESATVVTPGSARVTDKRGASGEVTFVVGLQPNTSFSNANTLEQTIYYVHLTPRWSFPAGRVRFFLGGGIGLWANLWREVADATYTDIFSCDREPLTRPPLRPALTNCTAFTSYRESDGFRRTVLPLSVSGGLTYQFLPHWSFEVEDRYLFHASGAVTLFGTTSSFEIAGNQILFGVAYRL